MQPALGVRSARGARAAAAAAAAAGGSISSTSARGGGRNGSSPPPPRAAAAEAGDSAAPASFGSQMEALQRAMRHSRTAAAGFALAGLATAIAAAELYRDDGYHVSSRVAALKVATTVLTVLLLCCIVFKYMQLFATQRLAGTLHPGETFWGQRALVAGLVAEVVVCAVHAPAGVAGVWYSDATTVNALQTLDSTLTVVMLGRLYVLMPLLTDVMGLDTTRARVIGRWNTVSIDTTFVVRAALELYPLRSVIAALTLVLAVLAYALRAFEGTVCTSAYADYCRDDAGLHDLSRYNVAVWAVTITALTVGFGDVTPATLPGKSVVVVTGVAGVVLIALMVATVTTQVQLDPMQRHALETLTVHELKVTRRAAAARLVSCSFQLAMARRRLARDARGPPHAAAAADRDARRRQAAFIAALSTWRATTRAAISAVARDPTSVMLRCIFELQDKMHLLFLALDDVNASVKAGAHRVEWGRRSLELTAAHNDCDISLTSLRPSGRRSSVTVAAAAAARGSSKKLTAASSAASAAASSATAAAAAAAAAAAVVVATNPTRPLRAASAPAVSATGVGLSLDGTDACGPSGAASELRPPSILASVPEYGFGAPPTAS